MPTNRVRWRRSRRADASTLNTWDEFGLSHGFSFADCRDEDGSLARERLAELWEIHGETFLAEWIAENPGTRPWGWWEFVAEEPRREVNPPRRWFHLVDEGEDGRRRMGRILIGNADGTDLVPWLEEERDYLERLGLLAPGEAERIDDELPEPGAIVPFDDED